MDDKRKYIAIVTFPGKLYSAPATVEVEAADDEGARETVLATFTSDSNAQITHMWEVVRRVV